MSDREKQPQEATQDINALMQVRREKMQAFREMGVEPFGHRYEVTAYAEPLKEKYASLAEDEEAGEEVALAGRLMAIRGHGKASFSTLNDRTGNIQIYFKLDVLGEEKYKQQFKRLDIGDIIGLRGHVFKTRRGEVTVRVEDFDLLSKSLRPLPEKFHGLKDVDTRYRQRYLDLIVNPEVRDTFRKRTRIMQSIRSYLDERDFLEVETPVLSTIAGGAAAKPFITHHNALDIDLYLRIATELSLKRLVVGGLDRVYEMGRVFRNEGMDVRHNPEFTSIEIYQAFADYRDLMDITEGIVQNAARAVLGTTKINYQGVDIDLENVKRISMNDAVKEATGKDFLACETVEQARALADELHVRLPVEIHGRHAGKMPCLLVPDLLAFPNISSVSPVARAGDVLIQFGPKVRVYHIVQQRRVLAVDAEQDEESVFVPDDLLGGDGDAVVRVRQAQDLGHAAVQQGPGVRVKVFSVALEENARGLVGQGGVHIDGEVPVVFDQAPLLDDADEVQDLLGPAHGEGGDHHVAAPVQGALNIVRQQIGRAHV